MIIMTIRFLAQILGQYLEPWQTFIAILIFVEYNIVAALIILRSIFCK